MASAVFFWNMACPEHIGSPKRLPMPRPMPNCRKHMISDRSAIISNRESEASLCTMFFTVMPVVMLSETAHV